MKKLNIVIGHYPDLFYRNGGLQVQIVNTYEALSQLGHNVKYYYDWLKNPTPIDVFHQFNIDISQFKVLAENRKIAKKVIVSPIFQKISSKNKFIIKGLNFIPKLNYQNYSILKNSLSSFDGYIFLGRNEKIEFEDFYGIQISKYSFIPNGIKLDNMPLQSIEFDTSHNPKYVISVGTVCKRKNQKGLIMACKELGIALKIVGPIGEKEYYEECLSEAKDSNVEFLGELSNKSQEFVNLVRNAEVFCLVSYSEVLPISVFEALGLGTKVVCTKNCSVSDYINDQSIEFCDPTDISSIKESLTFQFKSDYMHNSSLILEKYSWENVANDIVKFYNTLLAS
jgi:glycosyltransferase involved in cell wall biosynthesis